MSNVIENAPKCCGEMRRALVVRPWRCASFAPPLRRRRLSLPKHIRPPLPLLYLPKSHLISQPDLPHTDSHSHPRLTPLFERPASHRVSLAGLLSWRKWAQSSALAVGSKYLEADGGPDSEDFLRELEWMLEDAVSHGYDSVRSGLSMKWRDIKTLEPHEESTVVYLRASLEELKSLWVERVHDRRPFQYMVGCAHWRDYVLCVKEGVLIPRPETEQMIDLTEELIKAHPNLAKGLWADLGTGSGALAIGLGHILDAEGSVVAVDASEEALSIASLNVQRYGLQDKIKVIQGSWFSNLGHKKGMLAGVLSNPPYIPSRCLDSLQAEVGRHEPRQALDGGEQGTDDLEVICDGAAWALQRDGCLIVETNGGGQAELIAERLEQGPFYRVQVVNDYSGVARFVKASHA